SDGARKLQISTALRVDLLSARPDLWIAVPSAAADIAWPRSLRPAHHACDGAFGIGKRGLGILATEHGVLELGPEGVLHLRIVCKRPVAGHLVGVLELGLQDS